MKHRNIEQVAWAVILAAFAAFLALVVGLPWAGWRYLEGASITQEAVVECKRGAVQIDSGSTRDILSDDDEPRRVGEGTRLETVSDGEAMVSTFDGSTVHLGPQVQLNLDRLRTGRFGFGKRLPEIDVSASSTNGRDAWLWVSAADLSTGRRFRLDLPGGRLELTPASKACVWLRREGRTDVLAASGGITVATEAQVTRLAAGERARLSADGTATIEVRSRHMNLLHDGQLDAVTASDVAWNYRFDPLGATGEEVDTRPADFRVSQGRSVIRLARSRSGGRPADMVYEQPLDYTLTDGLCGNGQLVISATLRVMNQSVPGGGTASTEFPVRLKLTMEDREGRQLVWTVGFYALAPSPENDPEGAYHTENGILVPAGQWTTYRSENLLDPANPNGFLQLGLNPARIVRFEIIASGHDYESEVDEVGLWIE